MKNILTIPYVTTSRIGSKSVLQLIKGIIKIVTFIVLIICEIYKKMMLS